MVRKKRKGHNVPGVNPFSLNISAYLPACILLTCAKDLSYPFAHLFNLLLRTGKMPTLWKSANITPIHKGDSKELETN